MTVTQNGQRPRHARRRRRPEDSDWLSLVEPVGQFLTAPVLRSAFPVGLPPVPPELRSQARERLATSALTASDSADRAAWFDWLLRVVLGWGDLYETGDEAASVVREVPEYRTTLRADGILRYPAGGIRALVMRVPFGARFEARIAGEEWSASPLDRITELARAYGVPVALLTDTDRIALVNVPIPKADAPSESTGGYAVWQTALFAEGAERDYFAAFVALLHAQRFFNAAERETLEALFGRSALTQADLTKTLGLQVRKAVELLVGAFSRANRDRRGELLDALPPHTVYEAAATVMMRLVFLLYAEERDLLPIGDPIYAQHYAISTLREQLEADAVRLGDEPLERRATAWRRLLATFNAIFAGIDHDRLRLPAYGGRLFDPDRFAFLADCRVDDLTTRAILTALQTVTLGGESRRLSFHTLDVEQIGHVYEGLLDHDAVRVDSVHLGFDGKSGAESEIALADIEAVAERGRAAFVTHLAEKLDGSEKAIEKGLARGDKLAAGDEPETRRLVMTACESDEGLVRRIMPYAPLLRDDLQGLPTIYPGGGIIVTKTRARRDSGTEYTPRVLAEEIVRYALEPLVYSPGPVEGAPRDTWQVKPSVELLALKLCDPACGSGAFLVAACRYLAERVAEAWQREGRIADDDPIRDAQRLISERCLYGVDRDPMAVEMAKLSLWLLTFARHRPFSFLDHAIREGDSLIGITSLDQLRALHFDPARGRSLHDGAFIDVMQPLDELVQEAMRFRVELEQPATLDIDDALEKARLNDQARERTCCATLIADDLSAIAMSESEASEKELDGAYVSLADLIRGILSELRTFDYATASIEAATRPLRHRMDHDKPEGASTRRPLHWPLEFPEVLEARGVAFDLIVGNPPFLGGKFISGRFGTEYRSFLVRWLADGQRGHADLVAYFFLRAAAISNRFGFIATNTIAQGDTREVALDALLQANWTISRAEKTRIWPGAAAIQVSEVWCRNDMTREPPTLSGSVVPGISALLVPFSRTTGKPWPLAANARTAFIGTYVLGLGFTMTPEAANNIIQRDTSNRDVLFPYVNAEDVCDRPDLAPRRWIINFQDWSEERAQQYDQCFQILVRAVKPERQRLNVNGKFALRKPLPQRWWHYADKRPALYSALGSLTCVIAMPLHSKYSIPVRLPAGYVYSHALGIFASESDELYGVLSSGIHRAWSRARGSTMRNDSRYTPTDCFETFPLPDRATEAVGTIIRHVHDHRASLMLAENQGLTATYNRFHLPDQTSEAINQLRNQHQSLDAAVIAAYGWSDIDLDYDFRVTDEGLRFTFSEPARIEILDRLLELNHERHAQEVATGVAGNGKRGAAKPRGRNSAKEAGLRLLEVD
jgi:hypothetical protein